MTTPLVNASKDNGVMVLELRNPPANTYSYEMMRELDATSSTRGWTSPSTS